MMGRSRVEVAVGVFVILGILALGYLSVKLGRVEFFGGGGYPVIANFPSVGGPAKAARPTKSAATTTTPTSAPRRRIIGSPPPCP